MLINNLGMINKKDSVSLKDIGENCILASIKITDVKLFNKKFKRVLQVVEKSFYKYNKDWYSTFTKLAKLNLGFILIPTDDELKYINIQNIAPHHEFLNK